MKIRPSSSNFLNEAASEVESGGMVGRVASQSRGIVRVLVIDDDPVVRRLVERSLEDRAQVLQEFGVPEEGTLDLEDVDLVILDYRMPVRDGFDVLEEIREFDREIPILFLTGFGDPGIAQRALDLGASGFMTKPIEPSKLRAAVAELLPGGEGTSGAGAREARQRRTVPRAKSSRAFRALDGSGHLVKGTVSRFASQRALVEFPEEVRLAPGDTLREISFVFGRQRVMAAEGILGGPVAGKEGAVLISGLWTVEEQPEAVGDAVETAGAESEEGSVLDRVARVRTDLPEHFRLSVHEVKHFLDEVREEASIFSRTLAGEERLETLKAESAFVHNMTSNHSSDFWAVMTAFEKSAAKVVDDGLTEIAKPFARGELYPSILGSPFLARIVERPIGVPGDYGMLGQILGNPFEGYTLYDRILNGWILQSGAANAYRYRVDLLEREIRDRIARSADEKRPARILSMASGVAYEVQRCVQCPEERGSVEFTLVDFSDETLDEARRQYEVLGNLPESTHLEMHRSSVIDLAYNSCGKGTLDEGAFQPDSDYDLVYCAGLFDYLSDRMIRRVTSYLHTLLRPGGRLVVSNYTPGNPLRGLMTLVLDWELKYRSRHGFEELVRSALPEAPGRIEECKDHAEVYALVDK